MRQNWQLWTERLSDREIKKILKKADKISSEPATIFYNQQVSQEIRSSKIKWLSGEKEILDLLFDFVNQANDNAFRFNILKKADIQFTEYDSNDGDHYSWHHDVDWNRNDGYDRKISVTVQLTDPKDYKGGDFEFSEVETPSSHILKPKGSILAFPSYLKHRITPIKEGTRKSLVAWFIGPEWQ